MTFYLILAALFALGTVTAVMQARRLSYAMPLYFLSAWLVGELAFIHILWQLLLTVLVLLGGGLETAEGRWGLLLFLGSWLGMAYLHLQSMDTAAVLERTLKSTLGENYRGDIPQQRQGVLRNSINAAEWMRPFRMQRPGVRVHRNISYGEHGKRNHLDVYEPETPREGGFPVLLQVHGGAWMIGEKQQQALPLMYHLAQRGWLCVACNYRLSPKDTFPAHIIDVKKSIAWVREHAAEYGGNPDFLAITGGSAGGHLSSLAALTPDVPEWQPGFEGVDTHVDAAVPFYGIYDFLDRDNIRGSMSMEDMLAKHVMKCRPTENQDLWQQASPISHVRADAPPMLVLHGSHDSLAWVEEGRSFANRLHAVSDQVVAYAELPGAQHAFEIFHSVRSDHMVNAVTEFLEWCYARREVKPS
ncbi:MAG: alpha/beta hydrolase [Halieaceae bacterium]